MKVRKEPCRFCPYRRDVPSGVWAAEEYDRLAGWDAPFAEQPPGYFGCHATPDHICHGWAVVHGSNDREVLGLRVLAAITGSEIEIPPPAVPLFSSGREAAEHGKRDILSPSIEARQAAASLESKYERLRQR